MGESQASQPQGNGAEDYTAADRETLRTYHEGRDLSEGDKYGPLGMGHDPAEDPLKGLRGVMAGTLIVQAISVLFGLTVVTRIPDGQINQTFSVTYITILGLTLIAMAFLWKQPWALKANIVLQVFGVLAIFTYVSMGVVGIVFALVRAYTLHSRKNLIQRMERGLLTTQRSQTSRAHSRDFHPAVPPLRYSGVCHSMMLTITERTLILTKPDDVSRGLVGEVISRIERKGLKLVALDLRVVDEATAKEHYAEHADKPFFGELADFITSAPLVADVIEDPNAVAAWRQLAGGTNPVEAATSSSIRGDFTLEVANNIVHGSDFPESTEREIGIWFPNL